MRNIDINNLPYRYFDNTGKTPTNRIGVSFYTNEIKHVLDEWVGPTDNIFILCPIYENTRYKKWDIQIGVTGKVKFGESIGMAVSRELGEEIGFVVSDPGFESSSGDVLIRVTDLEPVTQDIRRRFPYVESADDFSRRIVVAAWGTKTETSALLNRGRFGTRLKDAEPDIVGVVALPFNLAMQAVNDLHAAGESQNKTTPWGGGTRRNDSWRASPITIPQQQVAQGRASSNSWRIPPQGSCPIPPASPQQALWGRSVPNSWRVSPPTGRGSW